MNIGLLNSFKIWMYFGFLFVGLLGVNAQSVSENPMQWHKVTITYESPDTYSETGNPNPFTSRRYDVVFSKGGMSYTVPGYFAADGNAGNSSASSGNVWKVNFSPPEAGTWSYEGKFYHGNNIHVSSNPSNPTATFSGTFDVVATDKTGRDMRAKGWLEYVGGHYLRFKGNGEYFLKQGPDAPENLLSYEDFDGDFKSDGNDDHRIKKYAPHLKDWKEGDPTWKNGKGKALIGAINYLASEGLNVFSFLTMNIQGDDKNVFPYINYTTYDRIDVSRMDQWAIVMEHGTKMGMFLHIKTQEDENQRLLDDGNTGNDRKLYYRELIARFGYNPALNWNLGEENGEWSSKHPHQSTAQRRAMAEYFYNHDPYARHLVLHNGQNGDDMYGDQSKLTGWSLQTGREDFGNVHGAVKSYLEKSANSGRPWAVACDEPGNHRVNIGPENDIGNSHIDGRKNALWGTFMAGGWGNEWYFGYAQDHSDLTLEDFRSRDTWWDYPRYALEFFAKTQVPVWEMKNNNNLASGNDNWVLAKEGSIYLVYLKNGGSTNLNVGNENVNLDVKWYNPRTGGDLQNGSKSSISGQGNINIGNPPGTQNQDWVALVGINNIVSNKPSLRKEIVEKPEIDFSINSKGIVRGSFVNISSQQSMELSLTNLKGKLLLETNLKAQSNGVSFSFDASDMKSALYVIHLKMGARSYSYKITINP